jgi:exosortase
MIQRLVRMGYWAKRNDRAVMAMFVITALIAFVPWVTTHLRHLWNRPHYQFFPSMLVALVVIGWSRISETRASESRKSTSSPVIRVSVPLLLLSLTALAIATWLNSPWFGFLSAFTLLLLFIRNRSELVPVILPLLILLPLPLNKDTDLVHWLQRVSSRGASSLLDMAGVRHVMSGNILEVADQRFFVEEACSGIGSVFLLLGSAAIYAVYRQLRLVVAVPLIIMAVGWAVAANTLRIFLVALSHVKGGPDLSTGIAHDLLGAGTYLVALLLMTLSEQWLLFFLDAIPERESAAEKSFHAQNGLIDCWNRMTLSDRPYRLWKSMNHSVSGWKVSRAVFCASLVPVLVGTSVVHGWSVLQTLPIKFMTTTALTKETAVEPVVANADVSRLDSLTAELFTTSKAMPKLLSFERQTRKLPEERALYGADSQVWDLAVGGARVQASVDGPFDSWHDHRRCLIRQGWRVMQTEFLTTPAALSDTKPVAQVELYQSSGEHALLLFAAFRDIGVLVVPPADTGLVGLEAGFRSRLEGPSSSPEGAVWQFQLMIPSSQPFDAATRNYWAQSFHSLLPNVLDHWKAQP